MDITEHDKQEMERFRKIINGSSEIVDPTIAYNNSNIETVGNISSAPYVPSYGIDDKDIAAMGKILESFNSVVNDASANIAKQAVNESHIMTERYENSVHVGKYEIKLNEDQTRMAGKQYYSIYNLKSNDIIADDVSLYEVAIGVVNLLNSGKYVNDPGVSSLFEKDNSYTSHYIDAVRFKRRMKKTTDLHEKQLFESRFQASVKKCRDIRRIISEDVEL